MKSVVHFGLFLRLGCKVRSFMKITFGCKNDDVFVRTGLSSLIVRIHVSAFSSIDKKFR